MVDAIDSKSILGCQGAGSSPVIGKLFLLDFDGLLVDTERLHYKAYQTALQARGLLFDVDFSKYIALAHAASGTGLKDFVYALYPHLQGKWEEIRKEKMVIYSKLAEENIELMPFVSEFLDSLEAKGIPSSVVTNSLKKDVDRIKELLPTLYRIPHWITRESYERPKPYPDGYLKALSLYPHILPKESVGLEDTLKGVWALKAAKVRPILICSDAHPQLEDAKEILHFTSLKPLIS